MTGRITTKRTATTSRGKDQDLEVSTDAPAGVRSSSPTRRPGQERRRKSDNSDPSEEERADRHLDHDQRSGAWRTASTSGGSRSIRRRQARTRHDPGRVRQAAGHRHADARLRADDVPDEDRRRALHRDASPTSAASPANVEPDGDEPRQGQGLDFTNISAPASSIKKDDGVQWSGTLTPAVPPTVDSITRRHRPTARRRLPAAVGSSA